MTTLVWHSTSVQLLLSETKLLNDSSVSLNVNLLEVVKKISSVTNHLEKAATAVVILVVALKVLSEVSYSVSKDSDLNLRRACVALMSCVLFDNCLLFCCCHFRIHLSKIKYFCKYELHRNREGEIHAFGYLTWSFTGVTYRLGKPCRRYAEYIISQQKWFVKRFFKKFFKYLHIFNEIISITCYL